MGSQSITKLPVTFVASSCCFWGWADLFFSISGVGTSKMLISWVSRASGLHAAVVEAANGAAGPAGSITDTYMRVVT